MASDREKKCPFFLLEKNQGFSRVRKLNSSAKVASHPLLTRRAHTIIIASFIKNFVIFQIFVSLPLFQLLPLNPLQTFLLPALILLILLFFLCCFFLSGRVDGVAPPADDDDDGDIQRKISRNSRLSSKETNKVVKLYYIRS